MGILAIACRRSFAATAEKKPFSNKGFIGFYGYSYNPVFLCVRKRSVAVK